MDNKITRYSPEDGSERCGWFSSIRRDTGPNALAETVVPPLVHLALAFDPMSLTVTAGSEAEAIWNSPGGSDHNCPGFFSCYLMSFCRQLIAR